MHFLTSDKKITNTSHISLFLSLPLSLNIRKPSLSGEDVHRCYNKQRERNSNLRTKAEMLNQVSSLIMVPDNDITAILKSRQLYH